MPIHHRLASCQGRRDQALNRQLALEIASSQDEGMLQELLLLFDTATEKRLLMEAILTIAYISEINPQLVASKVDFLIHQLNHQVSRVRWGSMMALSHLVTLHPEQIFQHVPEILTCMEKGSVVGRDYGFRILVTLYTYDHYAEDLFLIILEQLSGAPSNQLGQYTERLTFVLRGRHQPELIRVLEHLRGDLENEHHLRRLDKNLKKLYK
ncbi:MAG: hypothetical protein AAGA66_20995 [Bacteroidota bacterium]